MAALEAILLLVILASGLTLLAGQAQRSRDRLRQDLADRQIGLLREALTVYYLQTGTFPPGSPDFSTRDAQAALSAVLETAALLSAWPSPAGREKPAMIDPWHQPYQYLAASNAPTVVAENGEWPVFVSAGPDGRFGNSDAPAARADDRRSDELRTSRQ